MPEKGWKIITIREGTRTSLMDRSSYPKRGRSVDDVIADLLTSQGSSQGRKATGPQFAESKRVWGEYRKELQRKVDESVKKSRETGKDVRISVKASGVISRMDAIFGLLAD